MDSSAAARQFQRGLYSVVRELQSGNHAGQVPGADQKGSHDENKISAFLNKSLKSNWVIVLLAGVVLSIVACIVFCMFSKGARLGVRSSIVRKDNDGESE